MGDSTPDAGHGALPTVRHDADRVGTAGERRERHGSCPPDAASQASAVWRIPAEKERMKTAVEMTGHGRRGKPNAGFPLFHCLRFAFHDQIQKGGLAAELRSFSRLTVRLEYAPSAGSIPACTRSQRLSRWQHQ